MNITAATDFSPQARLATERAAQLARQLGLPLRLVHTLNAGLVQDIRDWLQGNEWNERLHALQRQALDEEAQRLAALTGAPVAADLIDGPAAAALSQAPADLLVVGSVGGNPVHHPLTGSTTARLLRKTHAPLLVVRQAPLGPYRRVLVPVDFSPWSERAAQAALRLAPDAQLLLMHCFSVPYEEKLRYAGVDAATLSHYRFGAHQKAQQQLQALAARLACPERLQTLMVEGEAPQQILQQAADRGCDLIVIGKHGRHAAEELLLGSVTRHVVDTAPIDVLVSTGHPG